MNTVFICDDVKESDLLAQELTRQEPSIRLEVFRNTRDALTRLRTDVPCDAVLLDASIPTSDAIEMASVLRQEKRPVGIVALVGTAEKNPPIDMFKAGVDSFVLKRTGFASLLKDALTQAKERHQQSPGTRTKVRLLCAGDWQTIKKDLSGMPHLTVEAISFAPDGLLKLPEIKSPHDEVLVIDSAAAGPNTLKSIKDVNLRYPEIPVILLTGPGEDEVSVQSMRAGAVDCITKTETYAQRLLPAIEREIKRHELARDRIALRSREERLRQIVETMPVGITVIAPDGTFLAINRAGLKLMGAARLEHIIGKNFAHLLPAEEREKVLGFLTSVSREAGSAAPRRRRSGAPR